VEPWLLVIVGAALLVIGIALSFRSMRRASTVMGEVQATRPGSGAVPRWISLTYLVGLACVVIGAIWWLAA
jgi:hypothetical protein